MHIGNQNHESSLLVQAQKYAALRKPYLINDMMAQSHLLNRKLVYQTLQSSGIPVPHHIIVDRDRLPEDQDDPEGFIETEDYVELNGKTSAFMSNMSFISIPDCAKLYTSLLSGTVMQV